MSDNKEDTVDITELVQQLRSDIGKAVKAAEGEDIQFDLGEIELELQTVVTGKAGAKLSIGVPIFKFDGNGEYSKATTQKIKIKLNPKKSDGTNIQLSDDDEDNSKPKVSEE